MGLAWSKSPKMLDRSTPGLAAAGPPAGLSAASGPGPAVEPPAGSPVFAYRAEMVEEKAREWLAAGASAVWTVDPRDKTVTVHRSGAEPITFIEDQDLDGGDVLPGFSCRVTLFFG